MAIMFTIYNENGEVVDNVPHLTCHNGFVRVLGQLREIIEYKNNQIIVKNVNKNTSSNGVSRTR